MGEVEAGKTSIRLYKFTAGALTDPGADIGIGTTLRVTATYETN
jgi:hypothetical protein